MFTLIDLPYSLDALEPVISARTLGFHYGKHLQTYVDNLNKLIDGTPYEAMSLEEIVAKSSGALFNNAGQVLNHNMYFSQFKALSSLPAPTGNPDSSVMPGLTGHLLEQISKQWGSVEAFKTGFEAMGTSLFGSGWIWLQANASGELSIAQYANADNPVAHGLKPILTFDVWEHAYYLDYQNRRAAHLNALWEIVNWGEIEKRYTFV